MADKKQWPEHLCGHTLAACQRKWLRDSGLSALLIGVPLGSGVPNLQPGDSAPPLAWPTWALAIGRKALDEDAAQYPDPKPLELGRARPALPFDGHERALFATRVVIRTVTLDFFGLGRPMSDEERLALSDSDREALGAGPVYILGGKSTAILRGDRLWDQKSPAVSVLRLARRWWAGLAGQSIRGRQPGDGAAYTDNTLVRKELDKAIRDAHQSTGRDLVDARTVFRRLNIGKSEFYARVGEVTGKPWPELAKEYAREFMESRRNRDRAR